MMPDLLCIGIVLLFSLLTWGLIRGCEILGEEQSEKKS